MDIEKLDNRVERSKFVLEQIIGEIKKDGFEIGDKLPSEKELAEFTGVSRTSVREALAVLRLTGVAKSKPGKGTYIKKKPGRVFDQALSILQNSASPAEMLEARAAIEGGITQLAVEMSDDSDVVRLERVLKEMPTAIEETNCEEFLSEKNKRFHLTIAEATKNTAVKKVMDSVLSYMEESLWLEERRCFYEKNGHLLKKSFNLHLNIFEAFKSGDKQAIRERVKDHFDYLLGKGSSV